MFNQVLSLIAMIVCIAGFQGPLRAQDFVEDSLYWKQDSLLDVRIDTLGEQKVLSEIQGSLRRAVKYCRKKDALLSADSASAWIEQMRWAVILEDEPSLTLIDDLKTVASTGEHGHWQYHFVYMTIWAAHEGHTKQYTLAQKADLILSHLNSGTQVKNNFYEERMIALGAEGIPLILDWVRGNIIPRMHELDREMLSEADLALPRKYDRFIMVFSNMITDGIETQLIRDLLKDEDKNIQRFAQDVLEAAGF